MKPASPQAPGVGISAVERDTGLSKDTLRAWERRYGFPRPVRDASGERLYGADDIERLRLLRRLVDAGHRPGRLAGEPASTLRRLIGDLERPSTRGVPSADAAGVAELLSLLQGRRVEALRARLSQEVLRLGLGRFVVEICAPLTRAVGEAWARGGLRIFEEHLYTESMHAILRASIASIPPSVERPRVLLGTVPGEPHGLGLLMAEVMLALEGARCLSLGTSTPVGDIVLAAGVQRADIVAVSFSAFVPSQQVHASLAELRGALPAGVGLWVGGGSPALGRLATPGVVRLRGLEEIPQALAHWRQRAG